MPSQFPCTTFKTSGRENHNYKCEGECYIQLTFLTYSIVDLKKLHVALRVFFMSVLLRVSHTVLYLRAGLGRLPDPSQILCAHVATGFRMREGGTDGERWGQKRETKRDEAPEASCYATADLLTYISKQKQLAAGYWSASPTQHRAKTHGLRNPCVQDTRRAVCGDHFAFPFEPDTKRLIIIIGRQIFGYTHTHKP